MTQLRPKTEELLGRVYDDFHDPEDTTDYAARRRDFIFHMLDWDEDALLLFLVLGEPNEHGLEASLTVGSFLVHAPAHINTAYRILFGRAATAQVLAVPSNGRRPRGRSIETAVAERLRPACLRAKEAQLAWLAGHERRFRPDGEDKFTGPAVNEAASSPERHQIAQEQRDTGDLPHKDLGDTVLTMENLLASIYDDHYEWGADDAEEYEHLRNAFVFHMTDWIDCFVSWIEILADPENHEDDAGTIIPAFLANVTPHLNEAARLLLGDDTIDPFKDHWV